MGPALLLLVALFALLFVARVGSGRRGVIAARWPALLLAGAALFAFARGAWQLGIVLAIAAGVLWQLWPRLRAWRATPAKKIAEEPADIEARVILGVGPAATASEIRAAYRAKMVQAHPDRGGSHTEAARLAAARDRLLRRQR